MAPPTMQHYVAPMGAPDAHQEQANSWVEQADMVVANDARMVRETASVVNSTPTTTLNQWSGGAEPYTAGCNGWQPDISAQASPGQVPLGNMGQTRANGKVALDRTRHSLPNSMPPIMEEPVCQVNTLVAAAVPKASNRGVQQEQGMGNPPRSRDPRYGNAPTVTSDSWSYMGAKGNNQTGLYDHETRERSSNRNASRHDSVGAYEDGAPPCYEEVGGCWSQPVGIRPPSVLSSASRIDPEDTRSTTHNPTPKTGNKESDGESTTPSTLEDPKRRTSGYWDDWIGDLGNPHHRQGAGDSGLRPPKLTLKPFDGNPLEWYTFKTMFRLLIHIPCGDDAVRACHLYNSLSSKLQEEFGEYLNRPELYAEALKEIEKRYGSPQVVSQACGNKLLALSTVKEGDFAGLKSFSTTLHSVVNTLIKCGFKDQLSAHPTLISLERRLPLHLQEEWAKEVLELEPNPPNLRDFDTWLEKIVMQKARVQPAPASNKQAGRQDTGRRQVNTVNTEQPVKSNGPAPAKGNTAKDVCPACEGDHHAASCQKFKDWTPEKRQEAVKKVGGCFRCLRTGHRYKDCRRNRICPVEGCKYKHHVLIHGAPFEDRRRKGPSAAGGGEHAVKDAHVLCGMATDGHYIALPVVTAVVKANGKSSMERILLDSACQGTMVHRSVIEKLGVTGPRRRSRLGTFHGRDPVIYTQRVDLHIESIDGTVTIALKNIEAVPMLRVSGGDLDWEAAQRDWPHLSDIPQPTNLDQKVTMVIGYDVPKALDILETRRDPEASDTAPRGLRTIFGWTIAGPQELEGMDGTKSVYYTAATEEEDEALDEAFRRFISIETFGTLPGIKRPVPPDDAKALVIFESSIRHDGERYVIALPWKDGQPDMPHNEEAARARFDQLERKFGREPLYAKQYAASMDQYLKDGHAHVLTAEEIAATPPGRSNYLTHHGVKNKNKPGKVRTVFHANERQGKFSLNERLHRGPDLLADLIGVLMLFREHRYGVSGDIEKMFLQVRVAPEDGPAFRYIWRTPGATHPPLQHQMDRMIFGAICSPSACAFVLRRTAQDNAVEYPELQDKVKRRFYADNYLDSFRTEEEAVEGCKRMRELMLKGGFNLTSWCSSSRAVMSAFSGALSSAPTLDLNLDDLPQERTLGLRLDCQRDVFLLSVKPGPGGNTLRELLGEVASIYDPLGFLTPVVLVIKLVLRLAYQTKKGWTEPLDSELLERWQEWASHLSSLDTLAIPRCIQPSSTPVIRREIHAFSDASENAFGANIYLRHVYEDGGVHTALLMAKARLAPLHGVTMPRLELNAALMAHRLVEKVKELLGLDDAAIVCWTDSTTVLRWIYSRTCRYHIYVAHRVAEIIDQVGPKRWRYVPTAENPADDCSRGLNTLTAEHRHFVGPDFLKKKPEEWPEFPDQHRLEPDHEDPEVRSTGWVGLHTQKVANAIDLLMSRCSDATKMERVAGRILRWKPPGRPNRGVPLSLSVDEIRRGHNALVRAVQKECFAEEMRDLKEDRPLKKDSDLRTLTPFLGDDGLLRVGGRIGKAEVPFGTSHPIILPSEHPFTTAIVLRKHRELWHSSPHIMLGELRSSYWIISGRASIRKIVHACIFCRRRSAAPSIPLMAALPAYRIAAHLPAFTNTGVDMFGPILVTVKRSSVKRYGLLFTCLSTRAVHLEMANNADMDSFLQAFSRFKNRRGSIAHLYSDNGTNFVAANKEIQAAIERLNAQGVGDKLANLKVQWHFNPPGAPHFGGAWERLIKSAKIALQAVLHNQHVTDEILNTALTEVEALLNSRPLTHVSVDPTDLEPLTPNHLLLGRRNPYVQPDISDEKDVCARLRFKRAQLIAEHFWRRWLREYLPDLTERKKWMLPRRNLTPGDLVLLIDPNTPRGSWPLGRIVEVRPGEDGVVRSAVVRTATTELTRPVAKICLLEEESTQELSHSDDKAGPAV